MAGKSTIEWTDYTWNFLSGCGRVSEGCDNCYAFALHDQRHAIYVKNNGYWNPQGKPMPKQYAQPFSTIQILPDRLREPLSVRQPKRWFVNSMSDFLHSQVPATVLLQAFEVMEQAHRHTFQILSKRPGRLRRLEWELTRAMQERVIVQVLGAEEAERLLLAQGEGLLRPNQVERLLQKQGAEQPFSHDEQDTICTLQFEWPQNAIMGLSVESDLGSARANALRSSKAWTKFLSCEPLLGPLPSLDLTGIHWVITGGESGPHARPCHPDWVRDLRDRCVEQGIAFFHKQWGGRTPKAGGRLLDGRTWDQLPVSPTTRRENIYEDK